MRNYHSDYVIKRNSDVEGTPFYVRENKNKRVKVYRRIASGTHPADDPLPVRP
jgi:hypothetical protein